MIQRILSIIRLLLGCFFLGILPVRPPAAAGPASPARPQKGRAWREARKPAGRRRGGIYARDKPACRWLGPGDRALRAAGAYLRGAGLLLSLLLCLATVVAGGWTVARTLSPARMNLAEAISLAAPGCSAQVAGQLASVTRTGGGTACLRASLSFAWEDSREVPAEGRDYTLFLQSGWVQMGGYYYYTGVTAPGDTVSLAVFQPTDTGRALAAWVRAQAAPAEETAERWGMALSDGVWETAAPEDGAAGIPA